MPTNLLAAAIALAIAAPALAQSTSIEPKRAPVVLHCGHFFDAASGQVAGETTIVADGARIKEVKAGHAECAGRAQRSSSAGRPACPA